MARLLVIDEAPEVCAALCRGLGAGSPGGGHEVLTADSVEGVQALMEEHSFDLIVLEPGIAQGRGLEILALLAEHPRNSRAPVIIITAHAGTETIVRSLSQGVAAILAKPFTLRLLCDKVETLLSPGRSRKGAFDTSLLRLVLECVTQVFDNQADMTLVVAGKPFLKSPGKSFHDYNALVWLKGAMLRGVVNLSLDEQTLQNFWRQRKRAPEEARATGAELETCCVEIAAQIFKIAQQRLQKERNLKFEILPPQLVRGAELPSILSAEKAAPAGFGLSSKVPVLAIPMSWGGGSRTLCLEFSLQVSEHVGTDSKEPEGSRGGGAGDVSSGSTPPPPSSAAAG